MFLQAYVDKLRVRVNEPVVLTVAFYQAVELPEPPQYAPPSTEGFIEEASARAQRTFRQIVDGVPYQVSEMRTILRPTAPGPHTIGPARLALPGLSDGGEEPRQPYSLFEHLTPKSSMMLRTDPVTIDVLPAGGQDVST